ncbi:hypothetical protein [Aggregatibacter actinomycetemcomitans]|uniref:hypothetical protein n=1 Tax=Aggregatibacter actinomycetemcomitans TaxID=714 RepID=UPI00022ABB78|nr:hypothetical protein [Aggregatibacter actinomycetemcomitans]KOE65878.1 hypothetical protein A160_0204365 [Aggregatibacter actinomycetemcomitans serotype e str. A160]KOE66625.1 hypothetical protein SCC393_0304725 [Aggregatibacter actinomycetemcomitans serotype e str. SCC393]KYK76586.1 hypothetical protein SA2876_06775 [Aggregatibacter actinomycetemcomitans serotype e str. SA2876]TYA48642.1 hypothetical protein FXB74_08735 [Aggregatibacter actinomycetemcomitans]
MQYTGKHFTKNGDIKLYHHVIERLGKEKLTARCVYIRLLSQFDGTNNGRIAAPASKSKEMFGVCSNTLAKGLKELERSGFITITPAGGRNPRFVSLVDYD